MTEAQSDTLRNVSTTGLDYSGATTTMGSETITPVDYKKETQGIEFESGAEERVLTVITDEASRKEQSLQNPKFTVVMYVRQASKGVSTFLIPTNERKQWFTSLQFARGDLSMTVTMIASISGGVKWAFNETDRMYRYEFELVNYGEAPSWE